MKHYKAGDKLANGAIVIDHDLVSNIVFADKGDGDYVSWQCDNDGNTFWGHYYDGLAFYEAVREYGQRIKAE